MLPRLESDLQASVVEGASGHSRVLSKCALERGAAGMERVWYLD